MELMWQTRSGHNGHDINLLRRIRRGQRRRPTRSLSNVEMKLSQTNLINSEPAPEPPRHHKRIPASNIISLDRLTLLDDPKTSLDNDETEDENEANLINESNAISSRFFTSNGRDKESLPTIPMTQVQPLPTNIREPTIANNRPNSTTTGRRSYLAPDDNLPMMPAIDRSQQSSSSAFSSTTALLFLLIIYIIWQCFRSQSARPSKCLDEWPATLLTPAKRRRKRRESDDSAHEMQTIEGFTSGSEQATNAKSAVLRVRPGEPGQPEIEVIQMGRPRNTENSARLSSGKLATLRTSVARNSFVVAANRAAKPRVKLIADKMRRFVDVEAQEAREGHEIGKTLRGRLVRILHSSGLTRAFAIGGNHQPEADSRGDDEVEPHPLQLPVNAQDDHDVQLETNDTIEVVVHRDDPNHRATPTVSRCESLLGFAGSFLENTVNPSTPPFPHVPPDTGQRPTPPTAAHGSNPDHSQFFCPTSSPGQAANSLNIPCHHHQQPQQQLAVACDCSLARSKSQANQTTAGSAHHLLGSSPTSTTNLRPCCSVSPSAMSGHQQHQVAINGHHLCSQQRAATTAFGAGSFLSEPPNGRARHHYENYYDDEQEDAYRRLTASIGMQFGLALDQRALMPNATGCNAACKCNPAVALAEPANFVCHQVGDLQAPQNKSSGVSSAGDSDSGVNCASGPQPAPSGADRLMGGAPDSENNICNDSTCSLCSSSLLTTTSIQDANLPLRRPSWDPTGGQQPVFAPVPRWHQQRRSTLLYARQQPRRTSIAGVASNPCHHQSLATEMGAQHYLHRASIASDGAHPGQHQQYPPASMHYHHYALSPNVMTGAADAPRAPLFPVACQPFYVPKASGYCSSAGSSSGIGFSGSQCLNTPTTGGAHAYGSFAASSKPYCDDGCHLSRTEAQQTPLVCQFALAGSAQTPACPVSQEMIAMNTNKRKFSLPAQLESHAAGRLMSNKYNPLFCDSQCVDIEHAPDAPNQLQNKRSLTGRKVISPPDTRRPADQNANRRLSQIITRQSSFWLEDDNSLESIVDSTNGETAAGCHPGERAPNDQQEAAIEAQATQASNAFCPFSTNEPQSPSESRNEQTPPPEATTSAGKRNQRLTSSSSSSSSTSSPSPDFSTKHKQRLLLRASQSTAITKKRLLANLKHRRPHRHSNTHSLTRRHGSQSTISKDVAQALKRQGTSSTDDERDRSKDGLSSFDREVATAEEIARITTIDANSTSMERQCRDLWKLRATLHGDDGSIADNWTNYHQRLNRRYDSGYKSIENQFSSSLEGNLPNIMNLSLRQASPLGDNRNTAARELDRPRSGCSGLIQGRNEDAAKLDASPNTLNEEETQSLLENCDEQQDEQ